MIDEKYRELIHADLDDELPETLRAEVSRCLLADSEVRAYAQDMKRVCQALDEMPWVPAPRGLREAIMERVAIAPGAVSGPMAHRPSWTRGTVPRYAAAFAAGLAASGLAFHLALGPESGVAMSDMAGTMASGGRVASSSPVDSVSLQLDQFSGEARLYDTGSTLLLEVHLKAKQTVEVVAVYDGGRARLSGVADASGAGERDYALALARPGDGPASVALQFFVGGVLVHEEALETGDDG